MTWGQVLQLVPIIVAMAWVIITNWRLDRVESKVKRLTAIPEGKRKCLLCDKVGYPMEILLHEGAVHQL